MRADCGDKADIKLGSVMQRRTRETMVRISSDMILMYAAVFLSCVGAFRLFTTAFPNLGIELNSGSHLFYAGKGL